MEVSHVSCLIDPLHEIHEMPFGKQVVKGPEDYDVKQWKGNAELFAALGCGGATGVMVTGNHAKDVRWQKSDRMVYQKCL